MVYFDILGIFRMFIHGTAWWLNQAITTERMSRKIFRKGIGYLLRKPSLMQTRPRPYEGIMKHHLWPATKAKKDIISWGGIGVVPLDSHDFLGRWINLYQKPQVKTETGKATTFLEREVAVAQNYWSRYIDGVGKLNMSNEKEPLVV